MEGAPLIFRPNWGHKIFAEGLDLPLIIFLLLQARMFPERKITMIFDMQQTGLAQMVRLAI